MTRSTRTQEPPTTTAGDPLSDYLTPEQAARRLDVAPTTLLQWCREGCRRGNVVVALQHRRIGRKVRVRLADLDLFARQLAAVDPHAGRRNGARRAS